MEDDLEMADENLNETADLIETDTGTPEADSPAEGGTPEGNGPESDQISAPVQEEETPATPGSDTEPEDPEEKTWKERAGEKDRYIRQLQAEVAAERSQREFFMRQQQAAPRTQTQAYEQDPYAETPPAADLNQAFMQQLVVSEVARIFNDFGSKHPDCSSPERAQAIVRKAVEIGFNPHNVLPQDLAKLPRILEDARTILYGHEDFRKQEADKKKKEEEKRKQAARTKVGAGVTDSNINPAPRTPPKLAPFDPLKDDPSDRLRRMLDS